MFVDETNLNCVFGERYFFNFVDERYLFLLPTREVLTIVDKRYLSLLSTRGTIHFCRREVPFAFVDERSLLLWFDSRKLIEALSGTKHRVSLLFRPNHMVNLHEQAHGIGTHILVASQ